MDFCSVVWIWMNIKQCLFILQGNLSDVIIWDVPGKQDEVPFIPVQSPANHIKFKNKNQSVDNEDADSDSKVSYNIIL